MWILNNPPKISSTSPLLKRKKNFTTPLMLKLHHLLVLNAKHQQPFQRVKGTFDQWLGSQVQWCSGCVAVHQSRDFTYGLCSKRILRHISLPKRTKSSKFRMNRMFFFGGVPQFLRWSSRRFLSILAGPESVEVLLVEWCWCQESWKKTPVLDQPASTGLGICLRCIFYRFYHW